MTLRRFAIAPLLALAIFACTPTVPSQQTTTVVAAVFDLAASPPVIPLPNDLVLQPQLNPGILNPTNAQDELLAFFHAQHGYPPDQVLPITFPISTQTVKSATQIELSAPSIDSTTLIPCTSTLTPANCNVFIFDTNAPTGTSPFPTFAASYDQGAPGAQQGTLTASALSGTKPTTWRPGAQYIYALRGGANGIKTTTGAQLQPSPTGFLLLFGGPSDFVCPSTNPQCPLPLLGLIHTNYLPLFGQVASQGFPLAETVVVGSFAIAPATAWVVADPASGTVPVPSNFLLDPATNHVSATAAAGFGIPALASLDGFSTTGMDIAQLSGPVLAGSIRSAADQGVYLYKLGGTTPVQVNAIVTQPPPITLDPSTGKPCAPVNAQGDFGPGCVTTVVGLQPAVVVPTALGNVALPPLEESTDYAVIITSKIKTPPAGAAITPTTLGQILLFTHPLCTPAGCATNPATAKSEIPGVPGAEAALLEGMRLALQPVVAQVATDHAVAKSAIMMPYTFRTQSITGVALQLGAAPYSQVSGVDVFPDAPYFKPTVPTDPLNPKAVTPVAMAAKWGVPAALVSAGISTFIEANVITYDKLDPATGAFFPIAAQGVATPVPAIIAIPQAAAPAGGWPLVVFHHGLGRSRGDSLLIAQALAGHGMVVAAIDAAKHGARAWCTVNTSVTPSVAIGCASGVTCDTTVFGNQADAPTAKPGLCQGAMAQKPIACAPTDTACWNGTGGNAITSGAFLISGNLFRSRDTVRQDILDQSMLVRVLTTTNGAAVLSAAAGSAVSINPAKVYYVGQSLGSIEGTADLAANPRFSRAVLNVGGATIMDALTTAPDFASEVAALLASLGITPGSPQYLQFLIGAKWILDPADPANFAQHVTANTLPNLLAAGTPPMAAKAVLGQGARCDATVPNGTNELLYGLMGLGPIDPTLASATPGVQWFMNSTGGTCPTNGDAGPGVEHGFLLDWSVPGLATTAQQNVVSYLLGDPVASTPVVVP